jgi:ferredoxin
MKYTIEVDRKSCISCGACYNLDLNHFEADRENTSAVVDGKGKEVSKGSFDDDLIEDAKMAAKSCPVSAILVTE